MRRPMLALALALCPLSAFARAEGSDTAAHAEWIREHYSKFEYQIPMRDGVRLFTAVYVPAHATKPRPFLLFRTPYSVRPYGANQYAERLGPSEQYAKAEYIFVMQDVRGRWMSEGTFDNMRPHRSVSGATVDESTDTFDTIDWLLRHVPGNNGKVGQWGVSYPGFYTTTGAISGHPALVAVSPQAPIADWWYDDMHHHGAFILPLAFNFFSTFGQARPEPTTEPVEPFDHKTPDGYAFFDELGPLANADARHFEGQIEFWKDIVAHPNRDAFWQARDIIPHIKGIKASTLVVGGWFDIEDLYGPLATYRAFERDNPKKTSLVMGPWSHGGWVRTDGKELGGVDFGFATAKVYRDEIEFPFFSRLLDGADVPAPPEAFVFETGANRWRRFDAWPPRERIAQTLYFGPSGTLAAAAPGSDGAASFLSDPSKPVPYTTEITTRWAKNSMVEDQRFAARRPDVLVFQTEPLAQDLTIAGPITADLWVSTDQADADWIVKVVDAYPGSDPAWGEDPDPDPGHTQRLVRWEVVRGRFRDDPAMPKPFVSGQPTLVKVPLLDLFHTFARGHRLMVQVQSTHFPLVDRNPQAWVDNIFAAQASDFVTATHRLHWGPATKSSLAIGVLPTPDQAAPAPRP